MDLKEARELAVGLMTRHGLTDWRLVYDDARTRAGVCRPDRKVIGLSRVLVGLYSPEQVTETVLHEIAHALVGPGHGHDAVWRAEALRIGCSGARCVAEDVPRVEGNWVGVCSAGHRVTAHRRPVRVRSCPDCSPAFDASALYEWTYRGNPAPMHPNYVAELARIRNRTTKPAAEPVPASAADATSRLRAGDRVLVKGGGRYGGLTGTLVKRGRTRFHVQTDVGVLGVPFAMVEPVTTAPTSPRDGNGSR
ncbi:SprT-like domain-containing protein [Actinoplanes sp. NPDC049802]|uniref:SprT-like domain-containing protein n=1 Tax=Actinoplanes sp. NPDC049802 TaxID=3154742 RepID=UPI003401978F